MLVEVPHAGLSLDPESLATLVAPARSIGRDADLYVDELFTDAPDVGATLLYSHVSRYVCDLNRSPSDLDSETAERGRAATAPHGLIWRLTTEGKPALSAPIPDEEVQRRLTKIYRPYHAQLRATLEAKREKFGFAILLCGHSMPCFGRFGERRADVVPGSRGRSTGAPELIDTPELLAKSFGYSVAHDQPYRGGFSTAEYGRPASGIHAVQLELNRSLYMDEGTLTRREPAFTTCRAYCKTLVETLGTLSL